MPNFNVLVAGIGGQGVLLLSKTLSTAACRTFPYVTRMETRGLSQRGGSVCASVRFGDRPLTPVIGAGREDLILSLDLLEALRVRPLLGPQGLLLAHRKWVPPSHLKAPGTLPPGACSVSQWQAKLTAALREHPGVQLVDLQALAPPGQGTRTLNVILLGVASAHLPLPAEDLRAALEAHTKPEHHRANEEAFESGRAWDPLGAMSVPETTNLGAVLQGSA